MKGTFDSILERALPIVDSNRVGFLSEKKEDKKKEDKKKEDKKKEDKKKEDKKKKKAKESCSNVIHNTFVKRFPGRISTMSKKIGKTFVETLESLEEMYANDLLEGGKKISIGTWLSSVKLKRLKEFSEGREISGHDELTTQMQKMLEDEEGVVAPPEPPLDSAEPGSDVPPEEEEGKEYIGNKGDVYFYLITSEGGVRQMVDADGNVVYPKEGETPPEEIEDFYIQAVRTADMDQLDYAGFAKYVLPRILGEDEEDEEEDELLPAEEVEAPEESPFPESKQVVEFDGKKFNISIGREGKVTFGKRVESFSRKLLKKYQTKEGKVELERLAKAIYNVLTESEKSKLVPVKEEVKTEPQSEEGLPKGGGGGSPTTSGDKTNPNSKVPEEGDKDLSKTQSQSEEGLPK